MIKQIIFILKNSISFQNFKIIKINSKIIIKYPLKKVKIISLFVPNHPFRQPKKVKIFLYAFQTILFNSPRKLK